MDIGGAIRAVRVGKRVRRDAWAAGWFIEIAGIGVDASVVLCWPGGNRIVWTATGRDLLADDWTEVER